MAKRRCLMTFYPTDCKDDCFNCECGGAEATKDMYVSINDVQRVCAITGGAADTDEGKYIAEVIRNNLENMVISAADVQPVRCGEWQQDGATHKRCSNCKEFLVPNLKSSMFNYCPNCGARMDLKDGDTE